MPKLTNILYLTDIFFGSAERGQNTVTTYTGTPSTSASYFVLHQVIQFSAARVGSSSSPCPLFLSLFRISAPRNGLHLQSVGLKHILGVNHIK